MEERMYFLEKKTLFFNSRWRLYAQVSAVFVEGADVIGAGERSKAF
jgi:hypothetical protein